MYSFCGHAYGLYISMHVNNITVTLQGVVHTAAAMLGFQTHIIFTMTVQQVHDHTISGFTMHAVFPNS